MTQEQFQAWVQMGTGIATDTVRLIQSTQPPPPSVMGRAIGTDFSRVDNSGLIVLAVIGLALWAFTRNK
jgi:hypothetical protein